MADRSGAVMLVPKGQEQPSIDHEMEAFMAQVQQVQTLADIAAMSGDDHISRLHRVGAKYFNMCAAHCLHTVARAPSTRTLLHDRTLYCMAVLYGTAARVPHASAYQS